MQPEQIELKGTIYDLDEQRIRDVWVRGDFNLHVPLWRYDFINVGEIPVPEKRIKLKQLLHRIQTYYQQPLTLAVIDYIERHDPSVEGELDEFKERILAGEEVMRSEPLAGLIQVEGFAPEEGGDYVLQLAS